MGEQNGPRCLVAMKQTIPEFLWDEAGTVTANIQQWGIINVSTGHSQPVVQGLWDTADVTGWGSSFPDFDMNWGPWTPQKPLMIEFESQRPKRVYVDTMLSSIRTDSLLCLDVITQWYKYLGPRKPNWTGNRGAKELKGEGTWVEISDAGEQCLDKTVSGPWGTVWGGAEENLCGTMNAKLNATEKTGVGWMGQERNCSHVTCCVGLLLGWKDTNTSINPNRAFTTDWRNGWQIPIHLLGLHIGLWVRNYRDKNNSKAVGTLKSPPQRLGATHKSYISGTLSTTYW